MPTIKELLEQQETIKRNQEAALDANPSRSSGENLTDIDLYTLDKNGLVEIAVSLKLDSPSQVKRWGVDKLRTAIREAMPNTKPTDDGTSGEPEATGASDELFTTTGGESDASSEEEFTEVNLDELGKERLVEIATAMKLDEPAAVAAWSEEELRNAIQEAAEKQATEREVSETTGAQE